MSLPAAGRSCALSNSWPTSEQCSFVAQGGNSRRLSGSHLDTWQAQKQASSARKQKSSRQGAAAALSQCPTSKPKVLVVAKVVNVVVVHTALLSSTASQEQDAVGREGSAQRQLCALIAVTRSGSACTTACACTTAWLAFLCIEARRPILRARRAKWPPGDRED